MPIKTRFEGPVLRMIPSGAYGWSDIQAALQGAMTQDGFASGRAVLLVDTTRSDATASSEELRDAAADLARLARGFAALLVVAPDDLRYGLARMLAAYAEHLGTELLVFRSLDAAEAWIRAHTTAPAGS